MTFKHKLSCRLALMKDRAAWAAVALAATAVLGCERPVAITDTVSPLTQFLVAPQFVTLQQNQSQDFTAVGLTATGDTAAIAVSWSTTGGSVDTSSNHGKHYGHYYATACGDYTVTARSNPGAMQATAVVSVVCSTTVPVASVVVTPIAASVTLGGTVQLTATPLDSAGTALAGRAVTWASGNTTVASVSASGLVTATAAGPATITATSEGKSGTASLTVTTVPIASVAVTPTTASLLVGQTVQLAAAPRDSAGNALTGRPVTWASNNTSVAGVSSSGLVTARAAGSATITATSEGKSSTSSLTVAVVPVAAVTVSPASASVGVGNTVQLTATPRDSAGNPLSGRTVVWTSSNGGVANVTATGLVTGVSTGSATITATSGGKSGTAAITVTSTPPPTGCAAACHYVDPAGSDGNPGTSTAPWQTIQHAADVMNPGDTVIVNDGVYTGGTSVFTVSRSGTASAWLVFRAAHRWGAVIDGQNNSSTMGVNISGNYVHVEGFEVRNTSRYGFEVYGGSETVAGIHDVDVVQNHIHDIGHVCSDDVGGRVGVDAYADNLTIERNVIHDVGRFGPGEQGCTPSTTVWQNHDHGIYHGVGNNVMIRNNVFYNFTHGWAIQRYSGAGAIPTGLTIVNNTFAFPNPWRGGQIIIATGTTNLLIANNVFYQPTTAGVQFETGGLSNVTVSNNLTYGGTAMSGASGLTVTGNLDNTDPLFVNAGGLDFRVQAGSPAIGAGLPLTIVTNDITGAARPATGGYTIGAYEFH